MSDRPHKILIVDDEPNMLHMLGSILKEDGFEPHCVGSAAEALEIAAAKEFDFILSDVRMPGMDGIQLVEHLRSRGSEVLVILMSAYGTIELALEAIRKGAYDYISKPFKTDEVVFTLRKAAERERLRREVVRLKRRLRRIEEEGIQIVGKSGSLHTILQTIDQVAPFNTSVLITGESGTGKELVARELHRLSTRSDGPFVAVNCGAIPDGLLESELFGHARGSFTGAVTAKPGLFEEADNGTLFLDEIGVMHISLQSKLLRALDSGSIRRIGETADRTFSVRIVAATNENLDNAMEQGLFRQDLYYRLNVVNIHIPPLRERREDVLPLIEHFVDVFNKKAGLKISGITREAQEALSNHQWRGNVRELQNVVERAMILAEGTSLTLKYFPDDIRSTGPKIPLYEASPETLSLKKASRELEKTFIAKALNRTGGNRSQAAILLEISYPSLLQKIKEYGLL